MAGEDPRPTGKRITVPQHEGPVPRDSRDGAFAVVLRSGARESDDSVVSAEAEGVADRELVAAAELLTGA